MLLAIGLGLVVLGGGLFLWARYAETPEPSSPRSRRARATHLLQVLPGRESCERARQLTTHRFPLGAGPRFPLPNCPRAGQCRCTLKVVPERRKVDRRSGVDRRAAIRIEIQNPPRRQGPGRRKEDRVAGSWWG